MIEDTDLIDILPNIRRLTQEHLESIDRGTLSKISELVQPLHNRATEHRTHLDLDLSTKEAKSLLKDWETIRLLLSEVENSTGVQLYSSAYFGFNNWCGTPYVEPSDWFTKLRNRSQHELVFRAGDRIKHESLGFGSVDEVLNEGKVVRISFDSGELKSIYLSYAVSLITLSD
jgi:hypothetical protein